MAPPLSSIEFDHNILSLAQSVKTIPTGTRRQRRRLLSLTMGWLAGLEIPAFSAASLVAFCRVAFSRLARLPARVRSLQFA